MHIQQPGVMQGKPRACGAPATQPRPGGVTKPSAPRTWAPIVRPATVRARSVAAREPSKNRAHICISQTVRTHKNPYIVAENARAYGAPEHDHPIPPSIVNGPMQLPFQGRHSGRVQLGP